MKKIFILFFALLTTPVFGVYTEDVPNACGTHWLLHAVWEPVEYTCSAGYFLPANTPGCSLCPFDYSCSGGTYAFSNTNAQGLTNSNHILTQNAAKTCAANSPHVFNAKWTPNIYNITYNMNGGTNYSGAPATYTYGTGATINGVPTRDGYVFAGWCTDSGLTSCAMSQTIGTDATGDKNFYAKWVCPACSATNASCSFSVVNNVCTYTTACNDGYYNITNNGAYNASCSACGGNNYYCTGGTRSQVSSGYYSTGGTETTRTGQSQCAAGHYCTGGVQIACPSGYTSAAGTSSISQCQIHCNAGTYVPSYKQLEYIESTGAQYIETGYYPTNNTGIKTKVELLNIANGGAVVFGGAAAHNSTGMEFYVWNKVAGYLYGSDKRTGASVTSINTIVEVDWNKNILNYSINNVQQTPVTFNSQTFTSPQSIWIAHIHRNSTPNEVGIMKYFYFQIYDNDTLVHDMIPVLDINDVPCMYDRVSNTFFYNAGTGTFTAGPVVGICTACDTGYSSTAHTVSYGNSSACSANTININWDGLSGASATTQCTYDGAITTPTVMPTRRGHAFAGWTFTAQ